MADGRGLNRINLGKHSLGTKDLDLAKRELHELDRIMAIKHGLLEEKPNDNSKDLTLENGWELFLEHCSRAEVLGGVSLRTLQRYSAVRDKHLEFCNGRNLSHWSEINRRTAEAYGSWLKKRNLADRTVFLELTLICSVVKWLIKEKKLDSQYQFALDLVKPQGTSTFCYTKVQFSRMVDYCRKSKSLEWMGDVIVALGTSGMRIGELIALRWSDVDLSTNTIKITDERSIPSSRQSGPLRRIKGKRGRCFPIHPDFEKVLKRLDRHPDGRVSSIVVEENLSIHAEC
jgi:integrase